MSQEEIGELENWSAEQGSYSVQYMNPAQPQQDEIAYHAARPGPDMHDANLQHMAGMQQDAGTRSAS